MTYDDVFLKYFTEKDNYFCMMNLFYRTLELYVDAEVLHVAYTQGMNSENYAYRRLEKFLVIYSDSVMIKARQLFTTSQRENSLVYQFFDDLKTVDDKKYFSKEGEWLKNNYYQGIIDRYQKLDIHSNSQAKYYKVSGYTRHENGMISYFRTPISIGFLPKLDPYFKHLARAIYHFRKNAGCDIGYSPIEIDEHIEHLERVYGITQGSVDLSAVANFVDDINKLLFYDIG